MANYIGYDSKIGVEQVDWSAITTDLIDGIKKEDERRVKKKGEIQKASDDLITEISDHQEALGSDTTYNGYVLDAAQQAKEFALMQNRLMKKGNLKPSEVVRSTQILSDDWKNFEKISKTFQETDAAARKAQGSGLSKQGELSYANFLKEVDINNSRLVVGPKDGRLYFQSKNGKLMDMATVNNRVADLPKDFDILKGTTGFTATIGKTILRDGSGGLIENVRNQQSFKDAQQSYIDSVNADPRNTLSVLTQSGYDVTEDPTKVDANTILLKPDENGLLQPELSEANITAAENELQGYIDSQLDKIQSKKTSPVGGQIRADSLNSNSTLLNDFAVAITGGNEGDVDVEAAIRAIQSKNPNITKIEKKEITKGEGDEKTTETILYVHKDGRRFPITLGSSNADETETITMNEAMNQVATLLGIPKGEVQPSIELWNKNNKDFSGKIDYANDFGFTKQTQIPQQDINNLKVGEESLTTFLADHQENNTDMTVAERIASSKGLVQSIKPLLVYVDKNKQKQTLNIIVDSAGSVVFKDEKGNDIVILDSSTGRVNTGNLQAALDSAQIESGQYSGDPIITNFTATDLGG